jgi:hypothetical protein
VALVLTACVTTAPKAPLGARPEARAWFALEVGARWTYEVKLLGETRTIDVEMLRRTDDGFLEDSTGAQFLADAYGVRDQKRYLLRNPIESGTRWTNVVSVQTLERYEIVGVGQPCEAPAGAWENCVIVESRNRVQEGTTLVNEMTFAPGVGIVRVSTVLETEGKQIPQSTLTLLRFSRPGLPERP